MSEPCFRVFIGIKGEFSKDDLAKLPPELRRAYSRCNEWVPEKVLLFRGEVFESFHLTRGDVVDPGKYVGFGIDVTGRTFNSGVYHIVQIKKIESTIKLMLPKVRSIFTELGLSAEVEVCFLLDCGS